MKQSEILSEIKKLKELQKWLEFNTPLIDENEPNVIYHRNGYNIICDLDGIEVWLKAPWKIHISKEKKKYVRACIRTKEKVVMLYLPRIIMGLQDLVSGETIEGKENILVEMIKDHGDHIIDLRKVNLHLTTRSLQSYKREAAQNNWGVSELPNGRNRARIFFPCSKRPLYLGSNYGTQCEAQEARDNFIREHQIETIIPVSGIKVLHTFTAGEK